MNPMQLMQMLTSGNPQTAVLNILKQQSGNNPILNNVYNMVQNGDTQGIEQVARNLCQEKGLNPEDIVNQIRRQINI